MTTAELKEYKKQVETGEMDNVLEKFGYYHGGAGALIGMYLQEHLSAKALKEFRKKLETRWIRE